MARKYRYKSDASEAIHIAAVGMYRAGTIDKARMRKFDESCLIVPSGSNLQTSSPRSASQTFDNVFDAIADTTAEAANMKVRADLLAALITCVQSWETTQEDAAKRLGVTRPRLDDLLKGKLGKFSLDDLVDLTAAAGLTLEIRVVKTA